MVNLLKVHKLLSQLPIYLPSKSKWFSKNIMGLDKIKFLSLSIAQIFSLLIVCLLHSQNLWFLCTLTPHHIKCCQALNHDDRLLAREYRLILSKSQLKYEQSNAHWAYSPLLPLWTLLSSGIRNILGLCSLSFLLHHRKVVRTR